VLQSSRADNSSYSGPIAYSPVRGHPSTRDRVIPLHRRENLSYDYNSHSAERQFFQKSSVFWDITSCSGLQVNWRFRTTHRFHLQDRISESRNQYEAGNKHSTAEDGGNMFLWNVGWISLNYTALHPRKFNSSTVTTLKPKCNCRYRKSPPLVRILRNLNALHTVVCYFHRIHFNSILPRRLSPTAGSFPFRLPTKMLYRHLTSPMPATFLAHPDLDLIALIIFGAE
jgi:hypothetical protein